MTSKDQLPLELPTVETARPYRDIKSMYSVDISHLYRFYILVNWYGLLEKSKVIKAGSDAIFECDNETIADEILNCIPNCKKRKVYVVPNFDPIYISGIDKPSVNRWKFSVERKLGYEKSNQFRSVASRWDY